MKLVKKKKTFCTVFGSTKGKHNRQYLDGVGEGESDDITGIDAGGDKKRGGMIDNLLQLSVC